MNSRPLTLLLFVCPLAAQQAIVNMPSADITPRGQHFLMHETQARTWSPSRYWYGTNFYTYGIAKHTEAAVTLYNSGGPAAPNMALGVGFKSAIPLGKLGRSAREFKLTVGQMGIQNLRGMGAGSFSYTHLSYRLPRYKTRLTAGGFYGTRALLMKNTGNFLAGVEHPVNKRVVIVAEWMAGNHEMGYFIPGLLFHLPKDQVIVAAYKFSNKGMRSAEGFVLEYGLTFGRKREESASGH